MSFNKVATRYANSLLDSSIEKKNLDVVASDILIIQNAFRISPQLKRTIESPIVKPETKKSILKELFKSKISEDSLNFLEFVIDKRREEALMDMIEKFIDLKNDYQGIAFIEIKTAFELNDDQKSFLKSKFEKLLNKKVNLDFKIDSNIIGGFVAKFKDTIYDASIIHQLELLKKQFLMGTIKLN